MLPFYIYTNPNAAKNLLMYRYNSLNGARENANNYGIDILVETSKYWIQRVDKTINGKYTLIDVFGPDEYKPYVTDNAYTNRMVIFNLEKTVELINLKFKICLK